MKKQLPPLELYTGERQTDISYKNESHEKKTHIGNVIFIGNGIRFQNHSPHRKDQIQRKQQPLNV